jgi:hypothetical protein
MNGQVPPFRIRPAFLDELRALAHALTRRSRYTTMDVPAEDFPTWCAALGVDAFHTYTTKSGNSWVTTHTVHLVDTAVESEMRMLSVQCGTPPAPWVQFPNGEGDRRYIFRSEMDLNPLVHNETESK